MRTGQIKFQRKRVVKKDFNEGVGKIQPFADSAALP